VLATHFINAIGACTQLIIKAAKLCSYTGEPSQKLLNSGSYHGLPVRALKETPSGQQTKAKEVQQPQKSS